MVIGPPPDAQDDGGEQRVPQHRGTYRPWAELLKRVAALYSGRGAEVTPLGLLDVRCGAAMRRGVRASKGRHFLM
jgi:hypothetical protein